MTIRTDYLVKMNASERVEAVLRVLILSLGKLLTSSINIKITLMFLECQPDRGYR